MLEPYPNPGDYDPHVQRRQSRDQRSCLSSHVLGSMSQAGQTCRRASDIAISRAKSHENQTVQPYCSHEPYEAVKVVHLRDVLSKNLPPKG
jgi:hypothetical protein